MTAKKLEDYFEFISPEEIQIKGHRIWMENILYEHIHNGMSPAELLERFPTLNLEKIYATLLYYEQNKQAMNDYVAAWIAYGERMRQEQAANPTPDMLRLRNARAQREAQKQALVEA
ncbi:MAG: DUF433 domain-containing protein [Chloroflexota bacterium]